jgi:hypothetical protein
MSAILQILRQIQRKFFSLRCLNRGPGHTQCNYSYTYSGFNIQLIVSALLLHICRPFSERYIVNVVPIQCTSSSLLNVDSGPGHIQCIYSSTYSGINIHLNVSVLLLEIYRLFNVRYPAKFAPNAKHIHQITQCELSSRPYTV